MNTQACATGEVCRNTLGGYDCIPTGCPRGFTLVNELCRDVDECDQGLHSCAPHERCQNTNGSFTCELPRPTRPPAIVDPPAIVCRKGYKVLYLSITIKVKTKFYTSIDEKNLSKIRQTTRKKAAWTLTSASRVLAAGTTRGVKTCREVTTVPRFADPAGTSSFKPRPARTLTSAFWVTTTVDRFDPTFTDYTIT